jgi:hypothetical protein
LPEEGDPEEGDPDVDDGSFRGVMLVLSSEEVPELTDLVVVVVDGSSDPGFPIGVELASGDV